MGCAASKVEQEDTVRRCKERRRHMKDAVAARQLLASSHADYLRSLRVIAAALSRFAQGHTSLAVSHHTAPVLTTTAAPPALAPTPPVPSTAASSSLPPPTPLAQHQQPPQQQLASVRAPWVWRLKVPHILSDSSVASPVQSSFRKPVVGTPSLSSAWDWENFYPPMGTGARGEVRRGETGDARSEGRREEPRTRRFRTEWFGEIGRKR